MVVIGLITVESPGAYRVIAELKVTLVDISTELVVTLTLILSEVEPPVSPVY